MSLIFDTSKEIEKEIVEVNKSKFGATIDNLIGNVTDGTLSASTEEYTLDFSGVKVIEQHGLGGKFGSTALTAVSFPDLTTVKIQGLYFAFDHTKLTNVTFPALTTISGGQALAYAFWETPLVTISFPVLKRFVNGTFICAFLNCKSLTDVYFNALTSSSFADIYVLNQMLNGTGSETTHTLHFPSNLEDTVKTQTGYPLFGGTDGYVVLAYDLEATE